MVLARKPASQSNLIEALLSRRTTEQTGLRETDQTGMLSLTEILLTVSQIEKAAMRQSKLAMAGKRILI